MPQVFMRAVSTIAPTQDAPFTMYPFFFFFYFRFSLCHTVLPGDHGFAPGTHCAVNPNTTEQRDSGYYGYPNASRYNNGAWRALMYAFMNFLSHVEIVRRNFPHFPGQGTIGKFPELLLTQFHFQNIKVKNLTHSYTMQYMYVHIIRMDVLRYGGWKQLHDK